MKLKSRKAEKKNNLSQNNKMTKLGSYSQVMVKKMKLLQL
jgi:hypothetical protein